MYQPNVAETERRRRVRLALWAYAYEVMHDSLVSDHDFDAEARKIDPAIDTGNATLDAFFRDEFSPDTGMWVHKHPERHKLPAIYMRVTGKYGSPFESLDGAQPSKEVINKPPFKTHFQNMCWLAYQGFRVVPGMIWGFTYHFEDRKIYFQRGDEHKVVDLAELFSSEKCKPKGVFS